MLIIGARIKTLRQRLSLTQQELADRIGCSRPSVVLWEQGERRIPLEKLRKLARALRVPISDLFGERRSAREEPVIDTREVEMLRLYRLMPARMQEAYLRLFEETALRESREPTLQPTQRNSVGVVETLHADG